MSVMFHADRWRPADCNGFIGQGRMLSSEAMVHRLLSSPPMDMREHDAWYAWLSPVRDQGRLDQCLGKALAAQATALYRRHHGRNVFPERHHVSGYAIWKRGRELHHGGRLDGGLTMQQGIDAVIDLGLYPPDTAYERIDPLALSLLDALEYSPVVQGTWTWPGWRRPHELSGFVGRMTGFGGGHATLVCAIDSNSGYWTPVFLNSWGPAWGRYGFGTLTLQQFEVVQLALPLAIRVGEQFHRWKCPAELIERGKNNSADKQHHCRNAA